MKKRITSCIAIIFLILSVITAAYGESNGNVKVYVTRTGECYHRDNCSYLKSRIEMTLEEADKSYRACSRCNPPILGELTSHDTDPYYSGSSGSSSGTSSLKSSYSNQSSGNSSVSTSTTQKEAPKKERKKVNWGKTISIAGLIVCGCAAKAAVDKEAEKNRLYEEEKKAQAEAERRQREREEFIAFLGGRSILDIAGVPQNIKFDNGYPRDNNNRIYGTYTVYVSKSGSCFHQKRGCCSAYSPVHAFRIGAQYRPCSKCGAKRFAIPKWYTDYIALRNKCKLYNLPFDEQRK